MSNQLQLGITAPLGNSTKNINSLVSSLEKMQGVMGGINTGQLKTLSDGIRGFADATNYFVNATKTASFTRVAKNINQLNSIKTYNLGSVTKTLGRLADGMNVISSTNYDGRNLTSLANAMKTLADADLRGLNGTDMITLGNNIKSLANALTNAPVISTNTISFTNAIARLGNAGKYIGNTVAYLPMLGSTLKGVVSSFSGLAGVSPDITNFTAALGQLASAGNKANTVTAALVPMATALKEVMAILSTAPQVNNNVLKMVSALGQLANSGSKAGSMARSLGRNMNILGNNMGNASRKAFSLASAIGKLYATYWLLFRAIKSLSKSVDIASSLTEVENVVDHTFGQMRSSLDTFTSEAIDKFGMSELASKQYASRYMAMGNAMGITNNAVAKSNEFLATKLAKSQDAYKNLGTTMGDMAVNVTKLAADYASFYDVSQEETFEKMQAIFTGMTKPLRAYGIDLTQATLKEWALKNGLDADIDSMTQAEKTMLRYQYVMANSVNIMGDFARTSDTWHNVLVKMRANLQNLGNTVGQVLINTFKPLMIWLNNMILAFNQFAIAVANSLGKIFGWTYEVGSGGIAIDVEDAADASDDLADGTGKAVDNAKKFKKQLQGIDELNNLTFTDPNDSGGKGKGSGNSYATNGSAADIGGQWKRTEALYKSAWDTLFKLGRGISEKISETLEGIDWNNVYKKLDGFGTGLASFLNGLITPRLFSDLADTISGSLNSALHFLNSFGNTFDFKNFGESIGTGITEFFKTFDWALLANTLDTWVDGIKEAIKGALETISLKDIVKGLGTFLTELDLDTFTIGLGVILWKLGGQQMALSALGNALSTQLATGIGDLSLSLGASIGLSIAVAIVGFKIGNWLYDNCDTIESVSDAIAAWVFKDGEEISVPKMLTLSLGGLAISFGAMKGIMWLVGQKAVAGTALKSAITGIASSEFASIMGSAAISLGTFLAKVGILVAVALAGLKIGEKYYEKVTGEEAAGGIKDLINMDATLAEVGQAISDGAVLDITITPLLRAISGDDSITTDEVINAMSDMIGDIVNTVTIGYNNIASIWGKVLDVFKNVGSGIVTTFSKAKTNITSAWNSVATWFSTTVVNPIANIFTNLGSRIVTLFTNARTTIANGWSIVSSWFANTVINPVGNLFTNLKTTISGAFSNALTTVKNAWNGITGWFSSLLSNVSSVFTGKNGIGSAILGAFQSAYAGIKSVFDPIGTFFKSVANNIISPIGDAINGVISGINWVLGKVGSKTTLAEWTVPKYAKGTDGLPKDTIGMVNDQRGSVYREMILPPNGQPFIPKGRNVVLPMEKGTKIMPARQTKNFMSGIPRFANGIGDVFSGITTAVKTFTGNMADYVTQPAKAMQIAIGKNVSFDGASGAVKDIAVGAVNTLFDSSVNFIKGVFEGLGTHKVEKAIDWALKIANDPKHGYDQKSRWGTPDYDCSSFVISAFEQAGIKLKSNGATYTGNMASAASKSGFNVVGGVNKATGAGLQRGDILLNEKHHVALYLGNGKIVHASANEFGKATGGKPGDQTGREIFSKAYYNYPWDKILRYRGFKNGYGKIVPSDFSGVFASGGFPEDGWFRANHEELIGKFDNGRTVVANNRQITEGISSAVYQGNQENNALLRQQNALMQEEVGLMKEFVAKEFGISVDDIGNAVRTYNQEYKLINGKNIFA